MWGASRSDFPDSYSAGRRSAHNVHSFTDIHSGSETDSYSVVIDQHADSGDSGSSSTNSYIYAITDACRSSANSHSVAADNRSVTNFNSDSANCHFDSADSHSGSNFNSDSANSYSGSADADTGANTVSVSRRSLARLQERRMVEAKAS